LIFGLAHNGSSPSPEGRLKDGTSILQDTNMLKARYLQRILKDERLFSKISGEEKTKKQPDYCPETLYSVYLLTNNKLHKLKSQGT